LIQRSATNWKWLFVFYLSLALGFLAKGPIAWTPLLTVAATHFFLRRTLDLRRMSQTVGAGISSAGKDLQPETMPVRLGPAATEEIQIGDIALTKRLKFVHGILLMLAVVALWGVPALIQTHGEFFKIGIGRHVIGRSFSAMESHGSNSLGIYLLLIPFYFVTIFASFFPWSIKLPSLTKRLWRTRDQVDIYLLCGAGVIFVIFSLIKTKLPHYTLPAFPLLALLAARHIESERFLRGAAMFAICLYLALTFAGAPIATQFFPAAQLYLQAQKELRLEMEFGAVDFQEPDLVWYFRSKVKGWMTSLNQKNAGEFMARRGARFVVVPTSAISKAFPDLPTTWKIYSTSGFNVAKGKHVDLALLLKAE
jgi:hypothetical protein